MGLAFEAARVTSSKDPELRTIFHLATGGGDRLADFEGFDHRQLFAVRVDGFADAVKDRGALVPAHLRPRALVEGLAGSHDAGDRIFERALGDGGDDDALIGRALALDALARLGVYALAAEQHLVLAPDQAVVLLARLDKGADDGHGLPP